MSDIAFTDSILLDTQEPSKETAKVLRNLPKSGPRVITRGSEPVGLLIPPSQGGIEADIDLLGRLRLGQALAMGSVPRFIAFLLLTHKARHSVCGNPAFNSSAIHAIVIVIRRLNSLAS